MTTPAAEPAVPEVETPETHQEPTSRLRRIIATRMLESLQTTAQLTTVVEVDVTDLGRLRDRVKDGVRARHGVGLSFLPFFCAAAVAALQEVPVVNAALSADARTVEFHHAQHLGIAVDTPRGLMVPVIRDAQRLGVVELARAIADLAARTRDNQVAADELSGGTFTVTNTGSRGALFDTPIVNAPQSAILGTGAVVRRPGVVTGADGQERIEVRALAHLALSYDHRLIDGADAARFLTDMKARLEDAASWAGGFDA